VGGHLIRRCKENLETAKQGTARLPHAVLRILQRALRLRDHWLDHPPTPHGRATHVGIVTAEMDRFLAWSPSDNENRKLVKHLLNERDALFTFLRDPTVTASNWWGEQAIRPAVVTRKIWGGNRTGNGAVTQQTIATFFRTSHQQGADPYPILAEVLRSPVPRLASLPDLRAVARPRRTGVVRRTPLPLHVKPTGNASRAVRRPPRWHTHCVFRSIVNSDSGRS
jgi:transposase